MNCDHLTEHLDAYVDQELDSSASESMRIHLDDCAPCRRRVAARRALSQLVRAAPYYVAEDSLKARVSARALRTVSMRRRLLQAVAAVALLAIGAEVALVRSASVRTDTVVAQVVDSHVRSLMVQHLFDVESTDQHTVKPWFLGRLDFAPPTVDLAEIGFPLIGGRLDYLEGRPVAALVYRRNKHTINLFVSPDTDASRSDASTQSVRGFQVHHWIREGMSFWAVSDLNDAELTQFVRALQTR